ncbi:MAG TPA: hypothetical protein VFS90_22930 [Pyrinomonadaceae bacterium]|nr:hypothetical protein [Pyrinomonadaceae bacterium]
MIINSYRRLVLSVTVVGLMFIATATSQEPKPHPTSNSNMSLATPDRLKWMPIRPGNEMAVVYGDPSKAGELYAVRFRFADGFKVR